MDAREFYDQIEKADDELVELSYAFDDLMRKTEDCSSRLEELATDAAEIKDEEKREKFASVLSILICRLNEISEECYKVSGEIDNVREYDFSELVIEADEMADEEKKNPSN